MEIKTCKFFTASELAKINPSANVAMEAFWGYDNHTVTWGDANRTMIDIPTFLDLLHQAADCADLFDEEGKHAGYDAIKYQLAPHRNSVYVDLEN